LPERDAHDLGEFVRMHSSRYTKLFSTQIDQSLGIADDKIRDTDGHFRQLAAQGIDSVFADLAVPVSILPLNPAEARELVLETVKRQLKG